MPGIDKTRFIDIDEDLLCDICSAVFVNPVITQCCQQTYCSDCIKEWITTRKTCPYDMQCLTINQLSQPPRLLVNMLNKQKMKCDFFENGCLEQLLYVRYKQHIKDCRHNPEAICGDCGEKNGQSGAHNCVDILVLKYKCLQNLQNNNKVLETENKQLIDRNVKLENDLLILNKKYDMTSTIKTETEIDINAEPQHTDNSIDSQLIPEHAIKREKDDSYSNANLETDLLNLKKIHDEELKELSEKLSNFMMELSVEKNKSDEIVNELNEKLKQKDDQIEEYRPLIEENNKLNENIKLLMKNIDRLSFIDQTNLDKTRFELEVTTDKLTEQYFYGNAVNIRGLCWNIKVKLIKDDNIEYLSFYLVCNRKSKSEMWSSIVSVEMRIKPQNKTVVPHRNVRRFSCVYSNSQKSFGYDKFMSRSTVFDENYGYVKDNTILLNVCVSIW